MCLLGLQRLLIRQESGIEREMSIENQFDEGAFDQGLITSFDGLSFLTLRGKLLLSESPPNVPNCLTLHTAPFRQFLVQATSLDFASTT